MRFAISSTVLCAAPVLLALVVSSPAAAQGATRIASVSWLAGCLEMRRGDRVDLTSGPRRGETYLVIRPGFLRERLADGKPGRLRCVLQG